MQVKERARYQISSLWVHYSQAIPPPGRSGHSSQGAAGTAAGAGWKAVGQKPADAQLCVWKHTNLETPSRHSAQLPFYSISGTFQQACVFMVHPQLSWSWKSLAASLSPVLYNADLLLCLTSGQTPEIVMSGGERGINLSCTLGKINLRWGMDEAPHLHLTTEDLCTRKSVWPVLLHSGSHQLMTPFVAWGWERAAHNSVHPCPQNSHTTLKHWLERSFGTMLLEVLPQFCVQQPGEVPEQGLSRQPIPLPCCSSHTVHSD